MQITKATVRLFGGWGADAGDAEGDVVVVDGVGLELEVVGDDRGGAGGVGVGGKEEAVVAGLEDEAGGAGLAASGGRKGDG